MPRCAVLERVFLVIAATLPLVAAGCSVHTAQASAPASTPAPSVAEEHPMSIAPDTTALPPAEPAPPPPAVPASAEATANVELPLPSAEPALPKPEHRRQVAEAEEPPPAVPAQPPQVMPQLSPGDQANDERQYNSDVYTAQNNLRQAAARKWNATQHDLADKISAFLHDAQAAKNSGDWPRARNLAQKARLISIDLLNSL